MKKFKRLILIIAAAVACVCMCFAFAACTEEDTKYDVAIRVECSDGRIYEFPVGTDELHIEIPYTGRKRTYWVDSYNLPDHLRWGNEWFSPSGEGANVFHLSIAMEGTGEVEGIEDRGVYCVSIEADSTSDLWNFRYVWLFITVK